MTLVFEQIGKVVGGETHLTDISLGQAGSPKAEPANEKPKGETVDYDQLIQAWREGRVK
jgi:hypothetical protein